MQVTEINCDGRFADPVVRDATADELAAAQVVFDSRMAEVYEAAVAEGSMRSAMAQLQQASPQLAQILYSIVASLGLNTFTVQNG